MTQVDPPRRGPLSDAVPLLALAAIAAFAGLVYRNELAEDAPESRPKPIAAPSPHFLMPIPDEVLSARPALVIGSYPGSEPLRPAEFAGLVRGTIEEIDATDDEERPGMVDSLGRLFRTDGDALARDPDGAEAFETLAREAEAVLVDLVLGDPAPRTREYAAMALGPVAYAARLEAPPQKLIDGLMRHLEATTPEGFGDDKVREEVGIYTFVASSLLEYARGPELIFRLFMDRHPKFSPALSLGAVALGAIQLLPSTMPRLIEGLSSEDGALCGFCLVSLRQMGRKAAPALPRLVALIREELDREWPRDQGHGGPGGPLGAALKAFARISPPDSPLVDEALLLTCRALERAIEGIRDPDDGVTPVANRPFTLKPLYKAHIQICIDTLKGLGRPLPAAAPTLADLFDSPRRPGEDFYPELAGILFAMSRGTPDQPRADACLRAVWRHDRAVSPHVARILRQFGAEAERVIPELKRLPAWHPEPSPRRAAHHHWREDRLDLKSGRYTYLETIRLELEEGSPDDAG